MIGKRKIERMYLKKGGKVEEDFVAIDRAINIFVNGKHYVTLIASPKNIRELAIGHLLGEGLIKGLRDLRRVEIRGTKVDLTTRKEIPFEPSRFLRVIPSACGASEDIIELSGRSNMPKPKSKIKFAAKTIFDAFKSLHLASKVFRRTGGTHAAALFTRGGKLRFCMEDVGRHNAVDKVIGKGLISGSDFGRSFMVSTGRLSADMVIKCARAGIPLVASRAAPLESGILAADSTGLTLVGFVRGGRLNVYTHPTRVKFG